MNRRFSLSGATWPASESEAFGGERRGGGFWRLDRRLCHRQSVCLTNESRSCRQRSLTILNLLRSILGNLLWRCCDSPVLGSTMCTSSTTKATAFFHQFSRAGRRGVSCGSCTASQTRNCLSILPRSRQEPRRGSL